MTERLTDEDLDRIEATALAADQEGTNWPTPDLLALVAEVRRLRASEVVRFEIVKELPEPAPLDTGRWQLDDVGRLDACGEPVATGRPHWVLFSEKRDRAQLLLGPSDWIARLWPPSGGDGWVLEINRPGYRPLEDGEAAVAIIRNEERADG